VGFTDTGRAGERADDEGVLGQLPDGHDDGERERFAGKQRGLQRIRVCARDEHGGDGHGDLRDQRGGDYDEQRGADVQHEFQWDVHAGDGKQRERELRGIHDTERNGVPAVGDTEHGLERV
jgi:hypothetical protein